jgi:hypothetical protein
MRPWRKKRKNGESRDEAKSRKPKTVGKWAKEVDEDLRAGRSKLISGKEVMKRHGLES